MKKRNSLKTKNDRTKLGPLNMNQLIELKEKASRNKDKSKIQTRINILLARSSKVSMIDQEVYGSEYDVPHETYS